MRRISVLAVALILALVASAHTQAPPSGGQTGKSKARTAAAKPQLLVKQLPSGAEGVELKERGIALKPGYKFVKGPNNTVTATPLKRGLGVGGTFDCHCDAVPSAPGAGATCQVRILSGNILVCETVNCAGGCQMDIVVTGVRTALMKFVR